MTQNEPSPTTRSATKNKNKEIFERVFKEVLELEDDDPLLRLLRRRRQLLSYKLSRILKHLSRRSIHLKRMEPLKRFLYT
jgi:hypothetical protein